MIWLSRRAARLDGRRVLLYARIVQPPRRQSGFTRALRSQTRAGASINIAVTSIRLAAIAVFAGLVLALGTAAPAAAGTPCWKALINDWFDGHIDHTYPRACYTQAIHHLPTDVATYSSAKDDIERALLAVTRHKHNGGPPASGPGKATRSTASTSPSAAKGDTPSEGVVTRAVGWLGPNNATSIPTPLLVLAGVAFLLLAAAGASFLNRRLQARRSPPPQA
jgi:hypothetical protein